MGLSIAITGGIVTFSIVYAMMSFPIIVDSTTKLSMSSTQMSSILDTIMHTSIDISNLNAPSNASLVTFSANNTGTTMLWNYNQFDVIITYQSSIAGNPTLTEVLQYATSCASLSSDHWCINSITKDFAHPGMLDPKEFMNIKAQLTQSLHLGGVVTVNFGTDNGILATSSVKSS